MSYSTIPPRDTTNATPLQKATGKMPYTLTNDYLFRATLQQSKGALKGLICAILSMKPEEITSVEITNPIKLGESLEAKDFIMDISVLLNNRTTINIELQVVNHKDWPDRSLGYMCRSFDSLNKGQEYIDTKPVIQVSFLDFTLYKEYPEFFSMYMFMNVKNHIIYSDKLKLLVVDLTQINKATEDDRFRGIDYWARLFKATTWEEIKMLSLKDSFLTEAAETVYQLSAEEKIRMQCQAREDYYRHEKYLQKRQETLEQELERVNKALADKDNILAAKDNEIAAKNNEIARLQAQLSKLQKN